MTTNYFDGHDDLKFAADRARDIICDGRLHRLLVGRSDMQKGQTFEEPHTYVMKRQLNATSKSQASKK
jgi:hypothetical protein